jgi:putative ABC transport system ATP-binding protein
MSSNTKENPTSTPHSSERNAMSDKTSTATLDTLETQGNGKSHGIPVLALDNVSYSYSKGGKQIFHNLSYKFESGKVYAITGPSGAGKTTLLSLLSGLTNPTEGEVLKGGGNLAKMDRYRYRSHDIGVIFQSFNLLPSLTVAENIILSIDASGKKFEEPKKEMATRMLERVRLRPEYANERILHLSGGEQQRVAIARALSYEPSIILADEPTGNLDLTTQDDIMDIFKTLAHEENKCVILVTHSPEVASQSDVVFQLAALRRRGPAKAGAPHGNARGGVPKRAAGSPAQGGPRK